MKKTISGIWIFFVIIKTTDQLLLEEIVWIVKSTNKLDIIILLQHKTHSIRNMKKQQKDTQPRINFIRCLYSAQPSSQVFSVLEEVQG